MREKDKSAMLWLQRCLGGVGQACSYFLFISFETWPRLQNLRTKAYHQTNSNDVFADSFWSPRRKRANKCTRPCKSRPVEQRFAAVAWRSKIRPLARLNPQRFRGMPENVRRGNYTAVPQFVFIEGKSRREAERADDSVVVAL